MGNVTAQHANLVKSSHNILTAISTRISDICEFIENSAVSRVSVRGEGASYRCSERVVLYHAKHRNRFGKPVPSYWIAFEITSNGQFNFSKPFSHEFNFEIRCNCVNIWNAHKIAGWKCHFWRIAFNYFEYWLVWPSAIWIRISHRNTCLLWHQRSNCLTECLADWLNDWLIERCNFRKLPWFSCHSKRLSVGEISKLHCPKTCCCMWISKRIIYSHGNNNLWGFKVPKHTSRHRSIGKKSSIG